MPSFVLWAIARYQLGNAFTPRAEARALVTGGLYRRLRHPIYTFGLCVTVGMVVYAAIPVLAMVPAALGALQVIRIRREERVLEDAFGDDYRSYREDTWF